MKVGAALVVLLALAGCREQAAPPVAEEAPKPAYDAAENGNLLNIAFGASVVSRTAEGTLDVSAMRAIDGDPLSTWQSPPGDPDQTIVFSLARPTRIEQIGGHTPPAENFHVQKLRVESSLDGVNFTPLTVLEFAPKNVVQLFPVTPVVASYLRATPVDSPGEFAVLYSMHVRGKEEGELRVPPIAGCWTVNGEKAWFEEKDGAIRGRIGDVTLEGALDGPLYRFIWLKEPYWGHAAITMAPDGKHLSGIKWHEQPVAYGYGTSWFGEKCRTTPPPRSLPTLGMTFMGRAKRYPVYSPALGADLGMELLRDGKRIRLVSREYRLGRAAAEIRANEFRDLLGSRGADLSRVDVVVLGEDKPRHPIETQVMRSLYGVVEIEQ